MKTKGITITSVFETSALNRDEKIADSILSIKKMVRNDGVYSFISRPSLRHYLFETLQYNYNWLGAPVEKDGQVIQFNFPKANIIDYPEIDLFGYMNTSISPTPRRKGVLGITKAVSLEPWQGDMTFGANHDLVSRMWKSGQNADPNPFNKEEHTSYYKASFTLDLVRVGVDEFYFKKEPKEIKKWIGDNTEKTDLNCVKDNVSQWCLDHYSLNDDDIKWYIPKENEEKIKGFIGKTKNRLVFIVSEEERKKRLEEVLTVLTESIMFYTSGECPGIVPQFVILGCLTVPVPVFHSCIQLGKNNEISIKDLNSVYLNKAWYKVRGIININNFLEDEQIEKKIVINDILNFALKEQSL